MKYKYYNKNGLLLLESDSEVKFNLELLPIFGKIVPVVEKKKKNYYAEKNEEDN